MLLEDCWLYGDVAPGCDLGNREKVFRLVRLRIC
jgi:hypothetical protein